LYEGNFKNGKKSGEGSLINPDGQSLKGIFKDNKLVETMSFKN